MASLTLRRLTKTFDADGGPALHELTLEVRDGEFLVLLGPSGSGKTTALRCIAGLEEPTAGDVLIGEREVTHLDRKSTRLNSSHSQISYAVFCLKKKKKIQEKN